MNNQPQLPNLADRSPIRITKKEVLSLDCPKCKKPLDVTDLAFGTNIECPDCENVTWRPEFTPKWWFRARNMILANAVSFVFGVAASITGALLLEEHRKTGADGLTQTVEEANNGR